MTLLPPMATNLASEWISKQSDLIEAMLTPRFAAARRATSGAVLRQTPRTNCEESPGSGETRSFQLGEVALALHAATCRFWSVVRPNAFRNALMTCTTLRSRK